jgi:hypothetical protein
MFSSKAVREDRENALHSALRFLLTGAEAEISPPLVSLRLKQKLFPKLEANSVHGLCHANGWRAVPAWKKVYLSEKGMVL